MILLKNIFYRYSAFPSWIKTKVGSFAIYFEINIFVEAELPLEQK